SADKSFVCLAANMEDRQGWFRAIGEQIQRLYLMGSIRKTDNTLSELQSVTVWVLENGRPTRTTYDITAPLDCSAGVIGLAQFSKRSSAKGEDSNGGVGKWA